MYARPKAEETDDDLLKMQELFQKNVSEKKVEIAAKVINAKEFVDIPQEESKGRSSIEERLANTFESIPNNSNIGIVVEKRKYLCNQKMVSVSFDKERGFPSAKRRNVIGSTGTTGSLFSQQMKRNIKNKIEPENQVMKSFVNQKELLSESLVLSDTDKHVIHEQNIKTLSVLPEAEILEERERLLTTMDPAIVAFLKSRTKQSKQNKNVSIKEQNAVTSEIKVEELTTATDILKQKNSEHWLNFDTIEINKLAWTKNVALPKIKKDEAYEARFDFEGWLMPSENVEVNENNRILFHHGEDSHRPGYTLQELFTLARSTVVQQKIISLNTVSNILKLYASGIYQDIIDLPIEQIFFLLRFCLDDNTLAVLNASTKAMRNLVFNHIDETCLDSLLGFGLGLPQPILPVDNEVEDDNTVNDQQLAETNLTKCLVRSGIYTRIRYIINTVKPSADTVVNCLEILTRLARDSNFVVTQMLNSEDLIKNIVTSFIPKEYNLGSSSPYGTPLLQAVKLMRILSCRNKEIASQLLQKYYVMDSISNYLTDDRFGANALGLRLQTECFHFWIVLLRYNLTVDNFSYLQSTLIHMLDYHMKNTDMGIETTYIREGHAAGLLNVISSFSKIDNDTTFQTIISTCIDKWCSQFCNIPMFVCGKSQIMSSLLKLGTSSWILPDMVWIRKKMNENIKKLINSTGFSKMTLTIRNGSMLLNSYEPQSCSTNLKTLQTSAWYTSEHVVPIIQSNSCIPFLHALSHYVLNSNSYELKLGFIKHENIMIYIRSLQKMKRFYLTNHWLTRIEAFLVMNIMKLSIQLQRDLDTSVFYELAVKSLCIFNSEQASDIEFILRNVVFCPNFYPSESLLENLNLGQPNENLKMSINNLNEIILVYTEVLGLKSKIFDSLTSFCVDISIGNIIPVDWTYMPILVLYTNQQQKSSAPNETEQIFIVKNCLRWILIYETYFPTLVSAMDPTDRFCRLACVFLGSDNLFLNEEIHVLLEICLKNIIEKEGHRLNFDKEIEGLANFQDFYTQLLEQYQGVSYGDTLFGNFVLVPLSQKQNVQWRKTLWSEYIGAVQSLNVTKENIICDIQNFLTPDEEDFSLLNCYRRALSRNVVRKKSVLYEIACHHCQSFTNRRNKMEEESP